VLASLNHPHIGAIYGFRGIGWRPRTRSGTGRRTDAGGSHCARPDASRRRAADRMADCRGTGGGARARRRPPRSETGEHQADGQGDRQSAGLWSGASSSRANREIYYLSEDRKLKPSRSARVRHLAFPNPSSRRACPPV
jgi:hypothetical protein